MVTNAGPLFRIFAAGQTAPAEFDPAGWPLAVHCAVVHQCAPMFRRRLHELGLLQHLPQAVQEQLIQLTRQTAARNLRGIRQLQELTTLLDGRVPLIALKGACLVRSCYQDVSLRPMIDLDVLARKPDLPAVREALSLLGYEQSPRAVPALYTNHDVPYMKRGMSAIELHWSLLDEHEPFSIDGEALCSRAVPARNTPGLFHLCVEDQLLHVCLHAGYHHQLDIGLYAFIDIAMIARDPDLDWRRAIDRAREWKAERCVFLMLELARALAGAEVPDEVLAALRPTDFADDITRMALTAVYGKQPRGYEPLAFLSKLIAQVVREQGWRRIPGKIRRRLLRKPEMRTRWPDSPHGPTWYGQFAPLAAGLFGLATNRAGREHLQGLLNGARVRRWMTPLG